MMPPKRRKRRRCMFFVCVWYRALKTRKSGSFFCQQDQLNQCVVTLSFLTAGFCAFLEHFLLLFVLCKIILCSLYYLGFYKGQVSYSKVHTHRSPCVRLSMSNWIHTEPHRFTGCRYKVSQHTHTHTFPPFIWKKRIADTMAENFQMMPRLNADSKLWNEELHCPAP